MNVFKRLVDSLLTLNKTYLGKVYEDAELNISAKEIGGKVEIVNADSTLSPAPDGEYKMSDGFTFEIKDGLITSIAGQEPVEAATEDKAAESTSGTTEDAKTDEPTSGSTEEVKAEDVPTDAPVEEVPTQDDAVAQLQDRVGAMESKLNEIIDMINGVQMKAQTDSETIQQFNQTVLELNSHIKVLANTPAQPSKTNTRPSVKEDNQQRMLQLSEILKGLK